MAISIRPFRSPSSTTRMVGAVAAAVASVSLLAGCVGLPGVGDVEDLVDEAIEEATGGESGGESTGSGDAAEGMATFDLPAEWPAEVPAPDAPIIGTAVISDESVGILVLFDTLDQVEAYRGELLAAGLENTLESTHDGGGTLQYQGAGWSLAFTYSLDADDNYSTNLLATQE